MRNLKFRGKTENNIWKYGSLLKDNPQKIYYIVDNEDGSGREVLEKTIGQYTGLKDKNGTEIYEGDIVSFNLKSDSEGQPNIAGYIEYQTTFSGYRIMSLKGSFALDYNIKDIEVIGNIYDNPELLEEGE